MAEARVGTNAGKSAKSRKKGKTQNKLPRTLNYLFQRDGLAEKAIPQKSDGFVDVNDILDVYSEFIEDDVHNSLASDPEFEIRQCPETNQLQIRARVSDTDISESPNSHPATSPTLQPLAPASRVASKAPRMSKDLVRLSKFMSYVLRHGAEKEGFKLQPGGFLYAEELLERRRHQGYTMEDVRSVVENNEKQRFFTEEDPETGRLRIRANQGHTIEVKELDLKLITNADDFPVVVHGTYARCLNSIKSQGLSRMRRNHIHMAPGVPGENEVISGMRGSCDVQVFINMKKAMKDGIKFYLSLNNVILSPGDDDGFIKPEYFNKIKDRR